MAVQLIAYDIFYLSDPFQFPGPGSEIRPGIWNLGDIETQQILNVLIIRLDER